MVEQTMLSLYGKHQIRKHNLDIMGPGLVIRLSTPKEAST